MPSDTSMNLKTSAAAAFCARLIVHPLDNVKVSVQTYQGVTVGFGPRLEHLLTALRRQLHVKHRKHQRHHFQYHHQHKHPYSSSATTPKYFYQEKISVVRGLYRGVPFALIFQVPGLALFLSTYDATKHALAQSANTAHLNVFQIHAFETHLVSGLMAKVAGSLIWAPMNKLQSLAVHPSLGQAQLSLKEAFSLTKQICDTEGMAGMWSGYSKSLSTLLPYTMLYFATYEHFKQVARKVVAISKTANKQGNSMTSAEQIQEFLSLLGRGNYEQHSSVELSLQTYMACVASAVIVSSTVCQTAIVLRDRLQERQSARAIQQVSTTFVAGDSATMATAQRRPPLLSSLLQTMGTTRPEIVSPLKSPTRIASTLSATSAVSATTATSVGFRQHHHPLVPAQFKSLMSNTTAAASQALSGLPWQQTQHASLTTTSRASGLLPFTTGMKAHPTYPMKSLGRHPSMIPMLSSHQHLYGSLMTHPTTAAAHFSSHNIISRPLGALSPYTLMNNTAATSTANGHVQATTPKNMTMTTTTTTTTTPYNVNDTKLTKSNSNSNSNNSNNNLPQTHQQKTSGLVRTIARGLGPRIMWTVPGVALTTAGFEVLRNMAS